MEMKEAESSETSQAEGGKKKKKEDGAQQHFETKKKERERKTGLDIGAGEGVRHKEGARKADRARKDR